MAQWSLDLTEYAKKKKVEIKEVRKAYAFALYSSIVKKTPVDTGRARGNWNVSVGTADNSTSENTTPKYSSKESLPTPNGDESIFISNNVDYITKLEYGSSKQAPNGMVGVTLANNENIFNAAVRSVRGE